MPYQRKSVTHFATCVGRWNVDFLTFSHFTELYMWQQTFKVLSYKSYVVFAYKKLVANQSQEPKTTASSCNRGGSGWRFFTKRTVRHWAGCPGQWSWHPTGQSSGSDWITLSDIWTDFWTVLCGARSWTHWSLQVPSNSGYSMITVWSYVEKHNTRPIPSSCSVFL